MYDRAIHCLWMFSNQPNYHYKLEFGDIEFRVDDANCTKDKIQVRFLREKLLYRYEFVDQYRFLDSRWTKVR